MAWRRLGIFFVGGHGSHSCRSPRIHRRRRLAALVHEVHAHGCTHSKVPKFQSSKVPKFQSSKVLCMGRRRAARVLYALLLYMAASCPRRNRITAASSHMLLSWYACSAVCTALARSEAAMASCSAALKRSTGGAGAGAGACAGSGAAGAADKSPFERARAALGRLLRASANARRT